MRTHPAAATSSVTSTRAARRIVFLAVIGLVLILGITVMPSSSTAASLAEKQAQAAALGAEVSQLEDQYGSLQERWRGELVELQAINADIADAKAKLEQAKADLKVAKARLQERAIAIYRDGGGSNQLVQLAEAGSFSEFFDRVDTIQRVGDQDASIVGRVQSAAERVEAQQKRLRVAGAKQAKVVRKAAKSKRKMQSVLASRQAALSSVTGEIRAIMARQRAAAAAADAAAARASAKRFISPTGQVVVPDAGDTGSQPSTHTTDSPAESEAPAPVSVPLPPPSGSASAAAGIAMGKVGAPYVYGAAGPNSFDCSGLVVWAFAQAGRGGLPHSTYSLIGMGVEVPMSEAQVGDLVFTNNSGHMGIYVGGGSMVHAPRTGRTVTVESLSNYSVVSIRRI